MPPDLNSLATPSANQNGQSAAPPNETPHGQQRATVAPPSLPTNGYSGSQPSALLTSLHSNGISRRRRSSALSSMRSAHHDQGRDISSGSPSERRTSLAQLYQDIENEQELQVNRLFALIREQQETIASAERSHDSTSPSSPPQPHRRDSEILHLAPDLRHDCAFYQAETRNLTRENEMLRLRIQELERQVAESSTNPDNTG